MSEIQKPIWDTIPSQKEKAKLDAEVCLVDSQLQKCSSLADKVAHTYLHGSNVERQKIINADNAFIQQIIEEGYEKGVALPSFVRFDGQVLHIETNGNPTESQNQELLSFYDSVVAQRTLPKVPERYDDMVLRDVKKYIKEDPSYQEFFQKVKENTAPEDATLLLNAFDSFMSSFITPSSSENLKNLTDEELELWDKEVERMDKAFTSGISILLSEYPIFQKIFDNNTSTFQNEVMRLQKVYLGVISRNPSLKSVLEKDDTSPTVLETESVGLPRYLQNTESDDLHVSGLNEFVQNIGDAQTELAHEEGFLDTTGDGLPDIKVDTTGYTYYQSPNGEVHRTSEGHEADLERAGMEIVEPSNNHLSMNQTGGNGETQAVNSSF